MTYLLDTNVLSELVSKKRTLAVVDWITSLDNDQLYVSVISVGELRFGINRLPQSKRKRQLTEWLDGTLLPSLGKNLLPVDLAIINRWAYLNAKLERIGSRPPLTDSLIAATADVHGLTIATRNIKDFQALSLPLFNPWRT